jgi:hypothetical protein
MYWLRSKWQRGFARGATAREKTAAREIESFGSESVSGEQRALELTDYAHL